MEEKLLKKMIAVVDEVVMKNKSDFYRYDLHSLSATFDTPEFFWSVREYGTQLLIVDEEKMIANARNVELFRFLHMRNPLMDCDYFLSLPGRTFHHHDGEFEEISHPKSEIDKVFQPISARLTQIIGEEFGEREGKCWHARIPIHFSSPQIRCKAWKKLHEPQGSELLSIFQRFKGYMRTAVDEKIVIGADYDENSFSFWQERNGKTNLNGGILFYNNSWHMHT